MTAFNPKGSRALDRQPPLPLPWATSSPSRFLSPRGRQARRFMFWIRRAQSRIPLFRAARSTPAPPATPGGPSFSTLGPGYGYYLMLYVYATNSAATADVSATITLEQASGGGPFTPVSRVCGV